MTPALMKRLRLSQRLPPYSNCTSVVYLYRGELLEVRGCGCVVLNSKWIMDHGALEEIEQLCCLAINVNKGQRAEPK